MKNPYNETDHPIQHAAFEAGSVVGVEHRGWNEQRLVQLAAAHEEYEKLVLESRATPRLKREKEFEAPAVPDRVVAWQKGYQTALREKVQS